jgi:hypothetical protein
LGGEILEGKNTLHPLIVVTNPTFVHLVFIVSINITFWVICICLKYIGLDLDFKKSLKKTPRNIGELQHMKYICDEIILVIEYEKLHIAKNPLRCTHKTKRA